MLDGCCRHWCPWVLTVAFHLSSSDSYITSLSCVRSHSCLLVFYISKSARELAWLARVGTIWRVWLSWAPWQISQVMPSLASPSNPLPTLCPSPCISKIQKILNVLEHIDNA